MNMLEQIKIVYDYIIKYEKNIKSKGSYSM